MIAFIRWQVMFLLVRLREHARWRTFTFEQRSYNAFIERKTVMALLDWISPFSSKTGYRRVWIRRIAFYLTVPTLALRRQWWRSMKALFTRLAPYTGPGKYEGLDPVTALSVAWLDGRTELADEVTGSLDDYDAVTYLFEAFPVPWSLGLEHWVITADYYGFVTGQRFDDPLEANIAFVTADNMYQATMALAEQ